MAANEARTHSVAIPELMEAGRGRRARERRARRAKGPELAAPAEKPEDRLVVAQRSLKGRWIRLRIPPKAPPPRRSQLQTLPLALQSRQRLGAFFSPRREIP